MAHIEIVGAMCLQLSENADPEEIKAAGFDSYFVDHGTGIYPCSAAGAQRPVEPPAQAGCRGAGECDLQQRRCTGDPVGQGTDGRCVCHLLLRIHHCAAGAAVDPRQFPFAGQQCAGLEKGAHQYQHDRHCSRCTAVLVPRGAACAAAEHHEHHG